MGNGGVGYGGVGYGGVRVRLYGEMGVVYGFVVCWCRGMLVWCMVVWCVVGWCGVC